jgi:hypothetical protein
MYDEWGMAVWVIMLNKKISFNILYIWHNESMTHLTNWQVNKTKDDLYIQYSTTLISRLIDSMMSLTADTHDKWKI